MLTVWLCLWTFEKSEMKRGALSVVTCVLAATILAANGDDNLVPPRREVYDGGRIFDISHRYQPDMPDWESKDGIGQFLWLPKSMKNGSIANNSEMKLPTHTGTHVDTPGHVFDHYFDAGFDVDTLDLHILNGPALLVDVPRDSNITAQVMESLNIPRGVKRVLFRTLNTDRRLMFQKEWDASYVGFTVDGAKWLVENTDIKLVGIDYLSVASYDYLIPSHLVFLKDREIILVEGLKLDDVPAGLYSVHCLPLRLAGAEGSPIRKPGCLKCCRRCGSSVVYACADQEGCSNLSITLNLVLFCLLGWN